MGIIKFMVEEFFRSFRKNLFKNLLLMAMFSTSLVMTILMGSYYLDLGECNPYMPRFQENGTWYRIGVDEDTTDMDDSTNTVQGCRNIMEYYERLHDSEEHPIFSVDTVNDCFMREDDVKELFGGRGHESFVSENNPETISAYWGPVDDGEICNILYMKCAMIDDKAFEVFRLRTEEGEGFTKSNLTIQNASDPIPVLLGNEYKGIVSIGDPMEIGIAEDTYLCRVAGILKKGSMVPWQGDGSQDMVLLDSHIIFPYTIRVLEKTDNVREIARYADRDLQALEFNTSMVWVKDDRDFRDVVSLFRDLGNEYNFPPLELYAASMGLRLFHKESAERVQIMLILTVTLIGFTFYGLFATIYDKIQSNKKIYGIYQMNGCSMGMILIPYLLEIAVVLAPAVVLCGNIFSEENIEYVNEDVIAGVMGCFIGLALLIGTVFVICLLKGVDTEQLMRQKD